MPRRSFHPFWYSQYMASDAWAERKYKYYRSHARRCSACFKRGKDIHLHHKQYQGIVDGRVVMLQRPEWWGAEPDDWLTPLCRRCHGNVHDIDNAGKFASLTETTEWYIQMTNRKKARHRRYSKLPLVGWLWR